MEFTNTRSFYIGKYFPSFIIIFFCLLTAAAALFISITDIRKLLIAMPDDSAYYFKIAENFIHGKGLTFDGINSTNGFQPLWFILILPVAFISGNTPEVNYRIYILFQLMFLFSSFFILFNILNKIFEKFSLVISILIFLFFVFLQANNGMESGLLVFLLVCLLSYSVAKGIFVTSSYKEEFVFGLILGLILLTRLDLVFFLISIYIFLFTGEKKYFVRKLLPVSAGLIITCLPYFLFNLICFGHLMPVSAALKSSFPEIKINFDFEYTATGWLSIFLSLAAAFFYLIHFYRIIKEAGFIPGKIPPYKIFIGALALSVILHFIDFILFIKWTVLTWHYIYYSVFLALAAGDLLFTKVNDKYKFYITAAALFFTTGILSYKIYTRFNLSTETSWHSAAYDASLWTKENTSGDDIFAMNDAGNFGYFSGRRVINLDGLVNSFEYQDVLRDKKLNEYLLRHRVKYLAHFIAFDDKMNSGNYYSYDAAFESHLYSVKSDPVKLLKTNEVYRKTYYNQGEKRVFLIWKIK